MFCLLRQLGGGGVLGGYVKSVAEKARTRGCPSLSLDGFGFIVDMS